jgi:hypothetical protein
VEIAFDLDELKALRLEESGEPRGFIFGGKEFELPAEMPWAFAWSASKGDFDAGMIALLGSAQGRRFLDLNPSAKDIEAIATEVAKVYAAGSPGESSASSSSSKTTSKSSRRPSKLATA